MIEVVGAVRLVDYRLKGEEVERLMATYVVICLSTSSADHPQTNSSILTIDKAALYSEKK